MPFEFYASIFNTILLFLTAVVRRDIETGKKRKEKSCGKVNWGHTLVPKYT